MELLLLMIYTSILCLNRSTRHECPCSVLLCMSIEGMVPAVPVVNNISHSMISNNMVSNSIGRQNHYCTPEMSQQAPVAKVCVLFTMLFYSYSVNTNVTCHTSCTFATLLFLNDYSINSNIMDYACYNILDTHVVCCNDVFCIIFIPRTSLPIRTKKTHYCMYPLLTVSISPQGTHINLSITGERITFYNVASQPRTSDRLACHWRALCLLAYDNWGCSIQPEIFHSLKVPSPSRDSISDRQRESPVC